MVMYIVRILYTPLSELYNNTFYKHIALIISTWQFHTSSLLKHKHATNVTYIKNERVFMRYQWFSDIIFS